VARHAKYTVETLFNQFIKRLVNNQWLEGKLENVFYVPDLNKNLLSVGACMSKSYKVTFKDKSVKLFLDNELMAQGVQCDNNLFNMLFKVQPIDGACPVTRTSLRRWHDHVAWSCELQIYSTDK